MPHAALTQFSLAQSTVAESTPASAEVTPDADATGAQTTFDALAYLNDAFPAGFSIDPKWLTYEGDGTLIVSQSQSELHVTCNAGGVNDSFWYNDNQGVLFYQEVTGDFDAVATVRVLNTAGTGLPTVGDGHYRIAGIAAHDPDRDTVLNYVHIGLGCTAGAVIAVEWKDTQDSTSFFADYSDSDVETGTGQIRLRREGEVYTFYYRATRDDAWILVQTRGRGGLPLPATVQLGFMAYSDIAGHDIQVICDDFTVTTP